MGIDSCCLKSMWMSHVMIEFLWYFCFPLTLECFFSDSGLICFGVSWGRGFTLNPHLSFLSLSNLWLCACAQSISTWGLTLCDFVDCSLPGSLVDGNFPGRILELSYHFLLQGIFPTGIKPVSSALASGFFTTELPGTPYLWVIEPKLHLCGLIDNQHYFFQR